MAEFHLISGTVNTFGTDSDDDVPVPETPIENNVQLNFEVERIPDLPPPPLSRRKRLKIWLIRLGIATFIGGLIFTIYVFWFAPSALFDPKGRGNSTAVDDVGNRTGPIMGGLGCLGPLSPRQCPIMEYARSPFGDVLFARYASSEGGSEAAGFDLSMCHTQRNLNPTGRGQATWMGQQLGGMFKAYNVAMNHDVYTSQWCRCRDTAKYMVRALDSLKVNTLGGGLGVREDWSLNSFYDPQLGKRTGEQCIARLEKQLLKRILEERALNNGKLVQTLMVTHQETIASITGMAVGSGVVVAYDSLTKQARELILVPPSAPSAIGLLN